MTVEYRASTLTNMDLDESKTAYKRFFSDGPQLQLSAQALRNSPFRTATACLVLLCVLLVAGTIGQSVHHKNVEQDLQSHLKAVSSDKEKLQQQLRTEQSGKRNLEVLLKQQQENYNNLLRKNSQILTNSNLLGEEIRKLKLSQSQQQSSSQALAKELEQAQSSREQLQRDRDSLSRAQNGLQAQYQAAVGRRQQLQAAVDALTRDRDNLQNRYNNASRARDQLQGSYSLLVQRVEQLQDSHNRSASQKEKMASSQQNLTQELRALEATCSILRAAQDQLQASYNALIGEKRQLEAELRNATATGGQWRKERDGLLETVNRLNATIQARRCPSGWRKFENSCYYASSTKKNWNLSRDNCKNKGADLVVINSLEEMTFVNGLYSSDKEVWIGLSDGGLEGQWTWVDGTPLTLTFWAKGQPNSHQGRNQDCVEFWHRSKGNGDWNDESCSIEQNWVCEM